MSKTPVLVVLGVLGAGLASIATNVATEALPVGVVPYRWVAWPMLVALAGVGIVVKLRETQPDELRADASPREVRDALISRVREYWVKSVLRESLYEVARIDLDMTVSANVRHPWGLTVAAPGMAPEALPPGTRMVEIVARFDGLLLVLGAPGAGKTTMLLELADELLTHAADSTTPIPVVFPLASWSSRSQWSAPSGRTESIDAWMVRELVGSYKIPYGAAERLVYESGIVVLLDGLDEVAVDRRADCVREINDYRYKFGTTRVVVCCRVEDYAALGNALDVAASLTVEPLRREQVEQFLNVAGEPMAAVRAALAEDDQLWTMLESPLLLSVVALAYVGSPVGSVETGGSGEQRRDRLFAAYVRRVLQRRPKMLDQLYPEHRMVRQLTFVAHHLEVWDRVLFHWEQLRWHPQIRLPSVVEKRTAQVRLLLGLSAGALVNLAVDALLGTAVGIAFGVLAALVVLVGAHIDSQEVAHSRLLMRSQSSWIKRIAGGFSSEASVVGLGFSWVLLMVIAFLGEEPIVGEQLAGYLLALVYGVGFTAGMIAAPVTPGPLHRSRRHELPGPWMRAILRPGLFGVLRIVLLAPVIPVLSLGLFVSWDTAVRFGGAIAIASGVVGIVWRGGYAVVEQILIRRALHRQDLLALPIQPLLDHAVQCRLMHRVGDEYMFIHRSLQECLAKRSPLRQPEDTAVEPILL